MKVDMPPMLGMSRWSSALEQAILWGTKKGLLMEERCGFFWQEDLTGLHFEAMENTAHEPRSGFAFDTAKMMQILDGMVERSFVGLFHTHPGGSEIPSGLDMQFAQQMEGSALGTGLEHWLLAAGSPQKLVRYDSMGVLAKITGQFIVDN